MYSISEFHPLRLDGSVNQDSRPRMQTFRLAATLSTLLTPKFPAVATHNQHFAELHSDRTDTVHTLSKRNSIPSY